jgi:streptogramin lyase
MQKRKKLLGIVVLVALLANLALAFGLFGKGLTSFAQSPGVTATDYYIASGQEPWGTTFDSKGNVWVAVPGCDPSPMCSTSTPPGKIEVFNPSTTSWIATYQLPAGFGQPLFVQFDASGNLWFAMPMSNSIGMLNPQTDTFQQFAVPTAGSGPWGLAIDHNGNIWFTEHYTNQIGEFIPSTQTMKEFATPSTNSLPYGIVVDASNNIWFTENNSAVAQIGEYTAGGTMYEYKIRNNPPGGLTPHMITVDPNGNVWWTEGWVGMIGELQVAQAVPGTTNGVTEYSYPITCSTCGEHTSGITVDGYGQVWFDDSMQGVFGSFPDSGQGSFSIYPAPTPQHPHDGINVDTQNRIWFTEEFANKLAVATQSGTPASPTPGASPSPSASPGPSSTASPSPTVLPSPSPTATLSPTPSPSPGTTLAQDTFQRANQQHWGKASDGQSWGGDANMSGVFSISSNTGKLSNGGSNTYNAVLGPTATDSEVILSGSLSSFKYANLGAVLHWSDTNDWYKAYIDGANLVIQKKVKGTATTLKTVPFAATAGTFYSIDFQITAMTLSVNVWKTGTTEPSGWMATMTDTSLASGYCGLRIQLQSGVVATITSFQALS